jgi:cytochrome c6
MKKLLIVSIVVFSLVMFAIAGYAAKEATGKSGEELYKQHCAICHPDGGNIVSPDFTLHKKNLQAHKITKAGDIIKKMRKPGEGMTTFDKKTVSDTDAKKIAEYILKTFK